MVREHKYRAWDKYNKQMMPVCSIEYRMQGIFIRCPDQSDMDRYSGFVGDRFDLLEYTGLKDSKGVEIYEGDWVIGVNGNVGGPSNVFYEYGVWQPFNYLSKYDGTLFEVISNVYETPELLEKEKVVA